MTTGTSCPVQSTIRRRTTRGGKKREKLATCVTSAVLRCTLGKQLIDCTTENKMRHDETACSRRSCQPFVLFSPVNESKGFGKRIDLSMEDKLMSYSGNAVTAGEAPNAAPPAACVAGGLFYGGDRLRHAALPLRRAMQRHDKSSV